MGLVGSNVIGMLIATHFLLRHLTLNRLKKTRAWGANRCHHSPQCSQVIPAVDMKVLSQRAVLGHVFTTKQVAAEKRSSKGYAGFPKEGILQTSASFKPSAYWPTCFKLCIIYECQDAILDRNHHSHSNHDHQPSTHILFLYSVYQQVYSWDSYEWY